jgi:hypothetical protein
MTNFQDEDGFTVFERDTGRYLQRIDAELVHISASLEEARKHIAEIALSYSKRVKPDGAAILFDRFVIYTLLCLVLWRVW